MTKEEHSRYHAKNKIVSAETRKKLSKKSKHRPIYSRRTINDDTLILMLKDYKEGMKLRQVDRKYNLSNGTFGNIIRGKIYYNKRELINSILI